MSWIAVGAAAVGAVGSVAAASQSGGTTSTKPWKPIRPYIKGKGPTPAHIAGNPLINNNWLSYVQSIGSGDFNAPWQPMTQNSPWFNPDQTFTPDGPAPQWQPFGGYMPNQGGPYTGGTPGGPQGSIGAASGTYGTIPQGSPMPAPPPPPPGQAGLGQLTLQDLNLLMSYQQDLDSETGGFGTGVYGFSPAALSFIGGN